MLNNMMLCLLMCNNLFEEELKLGGTFFMNTTHAFCIIFQSIKLGITRFINVTHVGKLSTFEKWFENIEAPLILSM